MNANYIAQATTTPAPFPGSTALVASSSLPNEWILDTGATSHLTPHLENIQQPLDYLGSEQVTVGNGSITPMTHTGQGILPLPNGKLLLSQLLHTPNISHNLISIHKLTKDNNISLHFDAFGYKIFNQFNHCIHQGPITNGLYPLTLSSSDHRALTTSLTPALRWHRRLGHPHSGTMSIISKTYPELHVPMELSSCFSCMASKSHKLVFTSSSNSQCTPLSLLHYDASGPSPTLSNQGFSYYLLIVDDYSHYVWLFPMRAKSEVTPLLINFAKFIQN